MVSRVLAVLGCFVCLAGALLPPASHANESTPRVVRVEPLLRDGYLTVSADLDFTLNIPLRDAVRRGVTLYFTADLTITQPRWWWFDRVVVQTSRTWQVAYNALTRQWRVGLDEAIWQTESLEDALQEIRQIRDWRVSEAALLAAGTPYQGSLRLRLDTAQLSQPLQVNALNSSSWTLATPWANFSFTLADTDSTR